MKLNYTPSQLPEYKIDLLANALVFHGSAPLKWKEQLENVPFWGWDLDLPSAFGFIIN